MSNFINKNNLYTLLFKYFFNYLNNGKFSVYKENQF